MKVLHAIGGISPDSGGPSRSVPGLCRALSDAGVETWLVSFSTRDELADPRGVHFLKGPGFRYADALHTARMTLDSVMPDIVHVHGLWTPANHAVVIHARRRGIPVVVSVRGMLDPWALAQKRWKKRLALLLYQRRDINAARLLHATAQQERENIRRQGFRQPVAVIPNGVDVPVGLPPAWHGKEHTTSQLRTALFVARLHPGKGLLDLAEAWGRVRPQGWRMRIVGPDVCGHKAEVQAKIGRLGLQDEFEFVGELDDEAKWQEYVNADLFVHPSHSENFGISIAEALAAGLPVITTKGTPWSELLGNSDSSKVLECESSKVRESATANGANQANHNYFRTLELPNFRTSRAGWWIDIGVEPLAAALKEALRLTEKERREMGERGRRLVEAKYTWPVIAERMKSAYESLLAGGVSLDCGGSCET